MRVWSAGPEVGEPDEVIARVVPVLEIERRGRGAAVSGVGVGGERPVGAVARTDHRAIAWGRRLHRERTQLSRPPASRTRPTPGLRLPKLRRRVVLGLPVGRPAAVVAFPTSRVLDVVVAEGVVGGQRPGPRPGVPAAATGAAVAEGDGVVARERVDGARGDQPERDQEQHEPAGAVAPARPGSRGRRRAPGGCRSRTCRSPPLQLASGTPRARRNAVIVSNRSRGPWRAPSRSPPRRGGHLRPLR